MEIILFDMDKTLVLGDTSQLWNAYLIGRDIVHESDNDVRKKFIRQYDEGKMDLLDYYSFEISLLKRIPGEELKEWQKDYFNKSIVPRISKTALRLIGEYRQRDIRLVLITASISFLAEPVAVYCGFDDFIATDEEIVNGEYTGAIQGIPNFQEGKVLRFRQWLDQHGITPSHVSFYSDSINDIHLMGQVNMPVAVNPDARLREESLKRGWQIINFM